MIAFGGRVQLQIKTFEQTLIEQTNTKKQREATAKQIMAKHYSLGGGPS